MHPRDDYDNSLRTRRRSSMSPPSQSQSRHQGHHGHHYHHGPDRKRLRPASSIETRGGGVEDGSGRPGLAGEDGWDREAYEPSRRMMTSMTRRVPHENSKSRRLYIGNVPYQAGLSDGALTQLFSALYVAGFGGQTPGRPLPVVSFWLHADGKFGFLELRGEQETVNMMCFNQTTLHGRVLKVNRPSDFKADIHAPHVNQLTMQTVNAKAVVQLCEQLEGLVIPPGHVVAQARQEVLSAATTEKQAVGSDGDMTMTGAGTGAGTGTVTGDGAGEGQGSVDMVIDGVEEKKDEGDKTKQSSGIGTDSGKVMAKLEKDDEEEDEDWYEDKKKPVGTETGMEETAVSKSEATAKEDVREEKNGNEKEVVISLQNLVTDKDLNGSQEDFEDILEDVREECSKYGQVQDVEIPRDGPFKGTAFVQFVDTDGASSAIAQLADRVFEGRRIIAVGVQGVTSAKDAANRR